MDLVEEQLSAVQYEVKLLSQRSRFTSAISVRNLVRAEVRSALLFAATGSSAAAVTPPGLPRLGVATVAVAAGLDELPSVDSDGTGGAGTFDEGALEERGAGPEAVSGALPGPRPVSRGVSTPHDVPEVQSGGGAENLGVVNLEGVDARTEPAWSDVGEG